MSTIRHAPLIGLALILVAVTGLVCYRILRPEQSPYESCAILDDGKGLVGIVSARRLFGPVEYTYRDDEGRQVCHTKTVHFRGRFRIAPVCRPEPGRYHVSIDDCEGGGRVIVR